MRSTNEEAATSRRASSPLLDVATLAGSTVLASGISAVASMVAARLLGPASFGIWQTARLVYQYTSFASLGVGWGMHREIPYVRARLPENNDREIAIVQVAFTFTLLAAGLVGLVTGIFGPIVFNVIPASVYYVLGVVIVTHQLYVFADKLATASGRFGIAATTNIVTSCASLILGVIGILTLGVPGLLLSQACWGVLGLIIIIQVLGIDLKPLLRGDVLRRLISIGLPAIGNGLLQLGARSLDRLSILIFLGPSQLGYYGLALAVAAYLDMAFQAIGRVVLPRLSARYAARGELNALRGPIVRVLLVQTFAFSALSGILVLWLPTLVRLVLPEYQSGIAAAAALLFGMVLLAIRSTLVFFFLATDRLLETYWIQLPLLVFGALFVLITMNTWPGILTAAIAVSAVYALISSAFLFHALRLTGATLYQFGSQIATLAVPICYSAAVTWLLYTQIFHLDAGLDLVSLIARSATATALFVLAQTPMVLLVERLSGIVPEMIQTIRVLIARRSGVSGIASESQL